MSNHTPDTDLGTVVSNTFGEQYLFAINRNLFQERDASTVFRSHYGDSLFREHTFYVIAGSDSGLLYQYVKARGIPEGSRYLFVESQQIMEHLISFDNSTEQIAVTTPESWLAHALNKMDLFDYVLQERVVLLRSLGVVHGHYSDYQLFWHELKQDLDIFMRDHSVVLNMRPFIIQQIENLTENQIPAIRLKDSFKGKTAVVLAGGPSLDMILPWVKKNRKNLLVIAVSRISKTLILADIKPDIVVSVDPHDVNLIVSKEMLEFQDTALLVNEYHLRSFLLASWSGKKVYVGSRYPWFTTKEPENVQQSFGATVTNTAFSLAMDTGVTQIILGGVDFCLSQTGFTHASGSAEHALGPRPMHSDKRVRTYSGKMADTGNNYLSSAQTLERQATEAFNNGCKVINPAPDAMQLDHIEHLPLDKIEIPPLEQTALVSINNYISENSPSIRIAFYKEVLSEVDRVLAELRTIKTLSKKALDLNKKLFDKENPGKHNHYNNKLNIIEKELNEKYENTRKFIMHYGTRQLSAILRKTDETEENIKEKSRLYFDALLDTSGELLEILGQSRNRILSRLEEEKEEPDIYALIKQWHQDRQPGRAIQWEHTHPDAVNNLSVSKLEALHTFQHSFDEIINEINKFYRHGIEKQVSLDGSASKARNYFRSKDKDGLHFLHASLQEHRDQEQAKIYLPMVEGYLAELDNKPDAAIAAYSRINQGPAQIDALMRLFEIHTRNQDLASALTVLESLSELSPVYCPMYADLLQATGDIEKSVEIYTDYLLKNPGDLNSMMKLGKIYFEYNTPDGVEWTMNYILARDPDNQAARSMLQAAQVSGGAGQ